MAIKKTKKTPAKEKKSGKTKVLKKSTKKVPKKSAPKKKKGAGKKGKEKIDLECFLSTACIQHKGLPDTCKELQLLRNFRDHYMRKSVRGNELVMEYYTLGPSLVKSIERDAKKTSIYRYIFECIEKACTKIVNEEKEAAQKIYTKMVNRLSKKYKVSIPGQ